MKRYHRFLSFAVLVFALLPVVSCLKIQEWEPDAEEGGLLLNVFCVDPETKAGLDGTRDGERSFNEDLLNTLDVFLYSEDGHEGKAVYHERLTPESGQNQGAASKLIHLTDDFVSSRLVPSVNSFYVYVIANYPGPTSDLLDNGAGRPIAELKALPLVSDFSVATDHVQSSFVMDGEVHVTSVNTSSRLIAEANVNLRRLAAKLSIRVRVAESFVDNTGATWVPMLEAGQMQMYLENGMKRTTMAGVPVEMKAGDTKNDFYFGYKNNRVSFSERTTFDADETDEQKAFVWTGDPMYAYPQMWEYASKDVPVESARPAVPSVEPSLKLILPWRRLEDTEHGITSTQKQFYYKIVIPDDTRQDAADGTVYKQHFVRNNWYQFYIDVGILGSETDEPTVTFNADYVVVDWQNKAIVLKQAIIGKARFLFVDQKQFTLNNETELAIPYTSSHQVTIKSVTATHMVYGDGAPREETVDASSWFTLDEENARLVFKHALENRIEAEGFDCSPYEITVKLAHKDRSNDANYTQQIEITQNPAIIIASSRNADQGVNTHSGYVIISGSTSLLSTNATDNWKRRTGNLDSSGDENNNPYMYVITTTVLSSDSDFILGDPRSDTIDNNLGNNNNTWSYQAQGRRLSYYYPTDDSSDKQMVIAPRFRIASSYGKSYAISYSQAEMRCAAYQESGYKAGRWRIPTRAEIEYMIKLSSREVIPTLFTPDTELNKGGYWCADGVIYPLKDASGNITDIVYLSKADAAQYHDNTNWVRCVYDEWYWQPEDLADLNTFTWGDQQR